MRAAIRNSQAFKSFFSAQAWKDYIIAPVDILAAALASDAAMDTYIRNTWGVVDPDLLMKGATGLHIVDASTMPCVPSRHTAAWFDR
ncbi:hypothetical protein B0H11DRAFT_2264204 [Mycena galericulata]|nr:hypothetical protein B0H11DRAFT_2264204 [Mycena galericulata]